MRGAIARESRRRANMSDAPASSTAWWRRRELLVTRTTTTTTATTTAEEERLANDAKARVQSGVLATFATWFDHRGGKIHERVRMTYRPNFGWSLEADGDIADGERLVSLPPKLMLRCDSDDVSEPLKNVVDRVPNEFWSSKVGLVLLRERVAGAHSAFAPYITLLPAVHEGSPTFFPPDAVRALEYAPIVQQINKRARFLGTFAGNALTVDDGESYVDEAHPGRQRVEMTIDANALGWATACASSRAFKVGANSAPAMLPVIDICNHSFNPSVSVRAIEEGDNAGGVELIARRALTSGEPIELSYGNLSNDELLLDYGFIVKDNPFDCVKLRWDLKLIELAREIGGLAAAPIGAATSESASESATHLDTVAKVAPWQATALERIGLVGDDPNVELSVFGAGQVMDKKALAGLRVLYSKSSAEASRAADAPFGEIDADVVSKDTEIKALRTCMSLLALALGNFSTTLEKDEELHDAATSPQVRLAIAFRMEKKKVLAKSMARLNESIERLQRDE